MLNPNELKSMSCPHKKDGCFIDIFGIDECCKECPDFWVNYEKMVHESIKIEEQTPDSNIHLIRDMFEHDKGKIVDFKYGQDSIGVLVAVSSTLEDYYWVYLNKDMRVRFATCCGKYHVLSEDEIPEELNDLICMTEYDRLNLYDIINTQLETRKYDKIITEIVI